MTSSMDSSLKFYMLARAGNIRNYVPNFDRAERDISTIIPGKEYAVTFAKSSRYLTIIIYYNVFLIYNNLKIELICR